jgi:hypothetical protein
MLADDYVGRVTLDPLGTKIPFNDFAARIEHEYGIIGDGFDEQAETASLSRHSLALASNCGVRSLMRTSGVSLNSRNLVSSTLRSVMSQQAPRNQRSGTAVIPDELSLLRRPVNAAVWVLGSQLHLECAGLLGCLDRRTQVCYVIDENRRRPILTQRPRSHRIEAEQHCNLGRRQNVLRDQVEFECPGSGGSLQQAHLLFR